MFFEGLSVHLLIAAAVALIVVGPKDMPSMLRKFGQFMAKVRAMAAEFRASFDEMARQSELDELRKEVDALRQGQLTDMASPETNQAFDEISQGLSDVGVQLNAPATTPYAMAQTEHIEVSASPKPRARRAVAKTPPAKVAAKTAAAPKAKASTARPAAKAKASFAKAPAKKAPISKTPSGKALGAKAPAARAKPRARKVAAS
jgi:sec-independent protein translocase protein TatB